MTTRRVFPREAMTAVRHAMYGGCWMLPPPADLRLYYTDAEFAAAFRPAEHLDQLIEAVRAVLANTEVGGLDDVLPEVAALRSALRQWDERQEG